MICVALILLNPILGIYFEISLFSSNFRSSVYLKRNFSWPTLQIWSMARLLLRCIIMMTSAIQLIIAVLGFFFFCIFFWLLCWDHKTAPGNQVESQSK